MTTTKIGLEDIAAINTAEEGRAVALALYNQLQAAQCWAIVTIETGVVDGPYAQGKPLKTSDWRNCVTILTSRCTGLSRGKVVRNERD